MSILIASPYPELRGRFGGSPRIVLLDVDGTLAPISPRPEEAVVPLATRRVIASLATRPGVHLGLVSGRAAADARRLVSVARIWVIGNHGLETLGPDGEIDINPEAEAHQAAVAKASRRIAASIAQVPGVQLEDKVWTLSVHYRRADQGVVPRLRASLDGVAQAYGLRLTEGKEVYELRPPIDHDKGTAVVGLARRLGGLAEGTSTVFIGDDRTDEDAFRALRTHGNPAVTIRVADREEETAAEFRLPGPDAVRDFLHRLSADGS